MKEMDETIIVDLSNDDCEDGARRKSLDRQKCVEMRKYIPFLRYVTAKDLDNNQICSRLLQWLTVNKEFPVRLASIFESRIKNRYTKLKLTTNFPLHITNIFEEEISAIVISDDEDEQEHLTVNQNSSPGLSGVSNFSNPKNNENKEEEKNNNAILEDKDSIPPSNVSNVNSLMNSKNSNKNEKIAEESLIQKTELIATSSKKHNDGKEYDTSESVPEEGEILTDDEEMPLAKQPETRSIHQIKSTNPVETADDAINLALFKKIDSLAFEVDSSKAISDSPWKDLDTYEDDQFQKSPILRQKNLDVDGETFHKKSLKSFLSDALSPVSDEEEYLNLPTKKKKKNKRHKKKKCDWYISEVENYDKKYKETTIKQKFVRKDIASTDEDLGKDKYFKKQKKSSKKIKEKGTIKNCRPIYISDDEETVDLNEGTKSPIQPSVQKTPDNELFKRRDPVDKERANISSQTVKLLESNEEDALNASQNSERSTLVPSQRSPVSTSPAQTSPDSETKIDEINSIPAKIQDISNMDLSELNDIYSKLCEKTGIQLEELLNNLVIKSKTYINEKPPCNEVEQVAHTNEISQISNLANNSLIEPETQKQQEGEYQNHLKQQQEELVLAKQHSPLQNQSHHIHYQANNLSYTALPGRYGCQSNLLPRLNLNDPRILQKLKQIKDSPIYNLSMRESAQYLVSHYVSPPQNRTHPIKEVTSNTATTYGEHKRLRELEKQREIDRRNAKQLTATSNDNQQPPHVSSISAISVKNTPHIESKTQKSIACEKEPENGDELITPTSKNRKKIRRIESSSSSEDESHTHTPPKDNISGRMTPIVCKKVVDFVFSAIGNCKLNLPQTVVSNSKAHISRRNSRSTDSTQSDRSAAEQESVKKNDSAKKTKSRSRKNSNKSIDALESEHAFLLNINQNDSGSINSCYSSKSNKSKKRGSSVPRNSGEKTQNQIEKTRQSPAKRGGSRELSNLNCTFLEYKAMFEKNWFPTIDGKRQCSYPPGSYVEEKLDLDEKNDEVDSSNELKAGPIKNRRKTCSSIQKSSLQKNNLPPLKVVIRRLSENGMFGIDGIDNDSTQEVSNFKEDKKSEGIYNQVQVKLKKLTFKDIQELTKNTNKDENCNTNSQSQIMPLKQQDLVKIANDSNEKTALLALPEKGLNVQSINESTEMSFETPILVPITSKPISFPTKPTVKFTKNLNNDPNMTLTYTKVCCICNKRPSDLTNHYVIQHKTESYVSRLTAKEIENLDANTMLAIPHRKRYKVVCVFCQDELEDHFVNFYAHYSYHTGEYGFKCDECEMLKPYREDIRSHQHRTSRCRNSKIRTNYLYSPDLKAIYLYICKLCNFVQLNEANVHKHQRDHHGVKFDEPQHVKRCIIAAIDSGEVNNEALLTQPDDDAQLEDDNFITESELDLQEQKFIHEFPLDIKDCLLTEENPLGQNNENNDCTINSGYKTCSQATKQASSSPETLLALLHEQEISNNVMTVVHCADATPIECNHQPLVESVDQKPNVEEIKIEPQDNVTPANVSEPSKISTQVSKIVVGGAKEQVEKTRICYRSVEAGTNFLGLYKCMFENCWFSTNISERFIEHSELHNEPNQHTNFNCAYCNIKSSSAEKQVRHVRSRHSMSLYQCSDCTYRSIIPGNVIIHRRQHHKGSSVEKCIIQCIGRVRSMGEKLAVVKSKMLRNVSSLKCPDCTSTFYAISSLKLHIQNAHSIALDSIDLKDFHKFACVYCKKESNDKESMREHLATDHPDEINYVIERVLKNDCSNDSIDNLNLINISMPVRPADIFLASFEEPKPATTDIDNKKPALSDEFRKLKTIVEKTVEEGILVNSTTQSEINPIRKSSSGNVTKEEQCVFDYLQPLLELLTEDTGVHPSTLYKCPLCKSSFFSYELWMVHVNSRHSITEDIICPYCPKQLTLDIAATHFESHRRHKYICYYCIQTFSSHAQIQDHFNLCHKEYGALIDKEIPFGINSFCIVKARESTIPDWMSELEKFHTAIRSYWIEKQQHDMSFEWYNGLASSFLEEVDIPQFIANGQDRLKCAVRSCPFVGSDENSLNMHLSGHTLPHSYKCSHCFLNLTSPSWTEIKNHKMLHKDELYMCCVCKFFYHNRPGITDHIECLHKSRDVPVLRIWRNETTYKISLTIVLPLNEISFTTSINCFCCEKRLTKSSYLVEHLKNEHNISLRQKCEFCDEIILTLKEAKSHGKKHGISHFKLKYEVLVTSVHQLIAKSSSPLTFEIREKSSKRSYDDVEEPVLKRTKLDSSSGIEVKNNVLIKTEYEENALAEDGNRLDMASGASIKCINISQLVKEPSNETNYAKDVSISNCLYQDLGINEYIQGNTDLQKYKYQNSCNTEGLPQTFLNNPQIHNDIQTYHVGTVNSYSVIKTDPNSFKIQQNLWTEQNILNNCFPQNPVPIINHTAQSCSIPETATTVIPTILPTPLHITPVNYNSPASALNQMCVPIMPEIGPVCGNCKMECKDFYDFKNHFEAKHAPKNERFLYRLTRRGECAYCPFRGSLINIKKHHATFHPEKPPSIRSVIDPRRCFYCDDIFSNLLSSNDNNVIPLCSCPSRKRVLADCLNPTALSTLQEFGKLFNTFLCLQCSARFNRKNDCEMHILNIHPNTVTFPELNTIVLPLYKCSLCERAAKTINEVIKHIQLSHFSNTTLGTFTQRMKHFKKIGVIFPKGLMVLIEDLSNSGLFDEESFKISVQCAEALNTS